MNVRKPQQSQMQISIRYVEKQNGRKVMFDGRKILHSLTQLTHDSDLIRRANALVLAQIASFTRIDTVTIRQLLISTLDLLGHHELAQRYVEERQTPEVQGQQLSFF
ncbi:ATP cone domain-containing protein [Secundilactobacillus malefermentans]|uniref:ATP-cone domain-containing protein n=1 Tax=Secundilactobacillus malefermentans TaxID=176292 RepID=A0A4R5NSI1_9LACO|nr:ATP cone domain-containing protein [Secundilactobacillus malefermentans]QEA31648.1 hypothetical protein FGL90_05320 [Secundilactobacillus malefermentans]TDG80074.1 hypothetical protein C5L31_000446 [Secundilactobacillus malefermentans]